jgi:two-component system LytT family response regulator
VQAFDGGAVDYVLKPVEAARLAKALERARSRELRASAAPPVALSRLPVSTRQGIVLIDPAHITHASLEGELVTLFTLQGELLNDASLQELEGKLPKDKFERVHRRALLNMEHVTRLEPVETGGYVARTTRGHAVEISRQSARALRKRLGLRKGSDEEPP